MLGFARTGGWSHVARGKALRGPWSVLGLLWVAFALNYVDRQIAYSIFPALRADLGFNQVQLGLVGTVFLWTYAIFLLPAGRAADRFSRRASLKQPGGKLVFAWALRSDFDPSKLKSNMFSMEWPPRSGRQQEFPEVDRAETRTGGDSQASSSFVVKSRM